MFSPKMFPFLLHMQRDDRPPILWLGAHANEMWVQSDVA